METEIFIVRRPIIETEIEECACDACTGLVSLDGIQQRHLPARFDIYRAPRLGAPRKLSPASVKRAARELQEMAK